MRFVTVLIQIVLRAIEAISAIFVYKLAIFFIEFSLLQTSEEVDKLYWKQQQAEWEQKKQDLLSAFTHSGTDLLNITVQQQVKSRKKCILAGSGCCYQEGSYLFYIERQLFLSFAYGGKKVL